MRNNEDKFISLFLAVAMFFGAIIFTDFISVLREVDVNSNISTPTIISANISASAPNVEKGPVPEVTEATEPEPTEPEPTEPEIDPQALEYLAIVIYQEAGGDKCCDECRRRVADVVLNRVADPRFPDTIYEVLTEKKQYGLMHWKGVVWPDRAKNPNEADAVARAYRIAEEVLRGQHSDLYGKGYIWQAEFKQGKGIIYCCGHYFGK